MVKNTALHPRPPPPSPSARPTLQSIQVVASDLSATARYSLHRTAALPALPPDVFAAKHWTAAVSETNQVIRTARQGDSAVCLSFRWIEHDGDRLGGPLAKPSTANSNYRLAGAGTWTRDTRAPVFPADSLKVSQEGLRACIRSQHTEPGRQGESVDPAAITDGFSFCAPGTEHSQRRRGLIEAPSQIRRLRDNR